MILILCKCKNKRTLVYISSIYIDWRVNMRGSSGSSGGNTPTFLEGIIDSEVRGIALFPHSKYSIRIGTFFQYGTIVSRSQLGASFVFTGSGNKGYTVRGRAIRKDRFPYIPIVTAYGNVPKRTFVESVGEPGGQGTVWTGSANAIFYSVSSINNPPISLNDFANKQGANNTSSLGVVGNYSQLGLLFGPPSLITASNVYWVSVVLEIVEKVRNLMLALAPAGLTKIDRVE